MTRKEVLTYPDYQSAANVIIETRLEIWGTNSGLKEVKTTLDVSSYDLESDWTDHWAKEVVLSPNSSTELFQGDLPGQPKRTKKSELPRTIVVSARLIDAGGNILARYSNW